MDLIGQWRSSVTGATVTALPGACPSCLCLQHGREFGGEHGGEQRGEHGGKHNRQRRGVHVTVSGGAQLASLLVLLEEARITTAHGAASTALTELGLKISLTNSHGTVAKLLFDGVPCGAGLLQGAVNGRRVFAQADLALHVLQWVIRQRQAVSQERAA